MFETNIVVVGNVLTAPEWRRTASTNALVANFRVASTVRRLDRETGRWVDGNQFRVRVNCWRRLAEGVAASVTVGDPVIVAGRLYTRDWNDAEGNLRTTYEMDAVSVGHDLARGRGRFFRNKPTAVTSEVETSDADGQVCGEAAAPVSEEEAPAVYGDGILDGEEPTFDDSPAMAPGDQDPPPDLRGGSLEPFDTGMVVPPPAEPGTSAAEPETETAAKRGTSSAGPAAKAGTSAAEPAVEPGSPAVAPEAEPVADEGGGRRAGRGRGSRRQPVLA